MCNTLLYLAESFTNLIAPQDAFATAAMARPALGSFPGTDWAEIIETGLLKVKPSGLDQLTTMQCGSSANEVSRRPILTSALRPLTPVLVCRVP